MILLYLDESGGLENSNDHFVVAGLAIHEADLDQFRRQVEIVVRRHLLPHQRSLELHAQPMRRGKGPWGKIPRKAKDGLLRDIPAMLGGFQPASGHPYALFGVVLAPKAVPTADPLERTFEEVLLRFNEFLERASRAGDESLGIVVADEAKYEKTLQPLVESWREVGVRRRIPKRVRRVLEVPLFVDSRATRLIQMADFVAHSVYRYYNGSDSSLFDPMSPAFDTDGGVVHGLVHLTPRFRVCPCPACISRKAAAEVQAAAKGPTPPRRIRPVRRSSD